MRLIHTLYSKEAVMEVPLEGSSRNVTKTESQKRRNVKAHPEARGIVTKLFPEEGYGFLKRPDIEEEVYFHKNSVLHGDFDRLAIGRVVRYALEMGQEGPQASSVQIISKPGARADLGEEDEDVPLDWKAD
jgi:cold shock CspA family protein